MYQNKPFPNLKDASQPTGGYGCIALHVAVAQVAQQEQQALRQDNEWLNEKLDEAGSQVQVLRGELETGAALRQQITDLREQLDSEAASGRSVLPPVPSETQQGSLHAQPRPACQLAGL